MNKIGKVVGRLRISKISPRFQQGLFFLSWYRRSGLFPSRPAGGVISHPEIKIYYYTFMNKIYQLQDEMDKANEKGKLK